MIMMCIFSFVLFGNVEAVNNASHVMKILDAAMDKMETIKAVNFLDEASARVPLSRYDIEFRDVLKTIGHADEILVVNGQDCRKRHA